MSVADKERAAFERYISSDIGPVDLKRSPAGHYESAWTRGAWFGWTARSLEIDALRDALADATERAKANATEVHILGERVRIECERRDQARRERDAAIARADALAARLAEVDDREHPA